MQLQSINEHNELYVQINKNDPIYDMIYISYIHLFIETSQDIFNNFITYLFLFSLLKASIIMLIY